MYLEFIIITNLQVLVQLGIFIIISYKDIKINMLRVLAEIGFMMIFMTSAYHYGWEIIDYKNFIANAIATIIIIKRVNINVVINLLVSFSSSRIIILIIENYSKIAFYQDDMGLYTDTKIIVTVLVTVLIYIIAMNFVKYNVIIDLKIGTKICILITYPILKFAFGDIARSVMEKGHYIPEACIYYLITIIFVIIISYSIVSLLIRNKNKEREIELSKNKYEESLIKYYDLSRQNQQEIRSLKHDIKGHINIMNRLLQDGEYEQAQEYLDELSEATSSSAKGLVNTGNIILDAIILERSEFARRQEITINFKGKAPRNVNVSGYDLSTIVVNLINNAIEYASSEGYMEIYVDVFDNSNILILKVKNKIREDYNVTESIKTTSKKDPKNHGIGLKNVEKTIEKYNGELKIYREKDYFVAEVFLFM